MSATHASATATSIGRHISRHPPIIFPVRRHISLPRTRRSSDASPHPIGRHSLIGTSASAASIVASHAAQIAFASTAAVIRLGWGVARSASVHNLDGDAISFGCLPKTTHGPGPGGRDRGHGDARWAPSAGSLAGWWG